MSLRSEIITQSFGRVYVVQPLSEWQAAGPGFSYKILVRRLGGSGNWSTVKTVSEYWKSAQSIWISASDSIQVAILSSNAAGDGPSDRSLIRIDPRNRRMNVPGRLILECDQGMVILWSEGATSPKDGSASYVLFWRSDERSSEQVLSDGVLAKYETYPRHGWVTLTESRPNSFKAAVNLSRPCYQYEYRLAKINHQNGRTFTSGLIKYTGCIYQYGSATVAPPVDVEIFARTKSSLSVKWRAPRCSPHTAFVNAYQVYYCEKGRNTTSCREPLTRTEKRVTSDVRIFELTDLKADTSYLVHVSSRGSTNELESVRVLATGQSETLRGWSVAALVGILSVSVLAAVMATLGIRFYWRGCTKLKRWYTKGITITMPAESTQREERQDNSSSANATKSERKQNGLHARTNFPLRGMTDRGRFSVVVSDIYGGVEQRPDVVYRDESDENGSSSDEETASPQSNDSGCQSGTLVDTPALDVSQYSRSSCPPPRQAANEPSRSGSCVHGEATPSGQNWGHDGRRKEAKQNEEEEDENRHCRLPEGRLRLGNAQWMRITKDTSDPPERHQLNCPVVFADPGGYVPRDELCATESHRVADDDVCSDSGMLTHPGSMESDKVPDDNGAYVSHEFVDCRR